MTRVDFLRALGLSLRDLCEANDFREASVTAADGTVLTYAPGEGLLVGDEWLTEEWLDVVGLVPA